MKFCCSNKATKKMIDSRNDADYLLGYDIDENAVKKFRWQKQKETFAKKQPIRERNERVRER